MSHQADHNLANERTTVAKVKVVKDTAKKYAQKPDSDIQLFVSKPGTFEYDSKPETKPRKELVFKK